MKNDNEALNNAILRLGQEIKRQKDAANAVYSNKYLPESIDIDSLCGSFIKYAEECEQFLEWLKELKELRKGKKNEK